MATYIPQGTVGSTTPTNAVPAGGTDGTNLRTLKTDTSGELQVDVLTQPARVATTDTITAKLATDKIQSGTTALTPLFAAFGAATAADNIIATNTNGGLKIRVLALCVIAGAAGDIYFRSDSGGSTIFGNSTNKIKLAANSGFVLPFNPVGWFETSANHDVVLNASTTGPFSGGLTYIEV